MFYKKSMRDLSIIIPGRNEEFFQKTIDNVLENIVADTEIIAVCDGYFPKIDKNDRVTVIYNPEAKGQRQSTNQGARYSLAKYIMKADAHCAFSKGFDAEMIKSFEKDYVVLPRMYTLVAFKWICNGCFKEFDQGAKPVCDNCGSTDMDKRIVWEPNHRKKTDYMWFNSLMRVKYFDRNGLENADKKIYSHKYREWAKGDVTDVMCGIGACWLMERDWYWKIGGMDENHGSWGQMGVELGCKAWMSGGRHVVNKKAWFAHLFRTQKDFTWPYENKANDQEKARVYSRDLWIRDRWIWKRSFKWLIEKFSPLYTWGNFGTI